MELTIDKFGRVIIPKKMRQHLGVGPGLAVEVQETPEVVPLLSHVRRASGLMMKDGLLIHSGSREQSDHINWDTLVQDEREERIRKIAGL